MTRYIFLSLTLIFCTFIPSMMKGQVHNQTVGTDSLYRKVRGFGIGLPQEKVYLHIDNTCYYIGDTIWYKGYVTRSDRGTLTDLSRILYVELLTPDGYLVERQQLEMPDGMAHGAFVLIDSLYAGYYELRAYTRWMLNFGQCEYPHIPITEQYFYSKRMAKEFFRDYEKLYSRVFPVFDKPKEAGVYPKDMTLRPMRRYYRKPKEKKPKLDLRFYPEGGSLIAGADCRVALELNDEDGQHIKDMTLAITRNGSHDTVFCQTDERGRSVFLLPHVSPEEKYHALFRHEGYNYREELPEAERTGCALTVTQHDSTVRATVQTVQVDRPIALHVMCRGVSQFYHTLPATTGRQTVDIPMDSLPTGVNQLTVFDGEGRIYADRLFFVNHHDYDAPRLTVHGLKEQYEPFDSITLHLQLTTPTDTVAGLSIAVRDSRTEEPSHDNGTMLTEMLLASELKGFVETPGYYFEADDSIHRQALDRLMMVQGWRRYDWRVMADVVPFVPPWLPEKFQTIAGCVNRSGYSPNPDFKKPSNLKKGKEVNVWAMFAQNEETFELKQPTKNGTFYMPTPKIYGECFLFLSAADLDKGMDYIIERRSKGFTDEEAWPDYYVKRDLFYPHFAHPYNYYQDIPSDDLSPFAENEDSLVRNSFTDRRLSAVTVYAKRGGLRCYDPTKPAVVIDANDAYNLAADYGLQDAPFYYVTDSFTHTMAMLYVGDMNMHRRYAIQRLRDGIGYNASKSLPTAQRRGKEWEYKSLSRLDKLYIYTDYVPREMGSWKYKQANQPEVIVDYRLRPNGEYFPSCRDRRYLLRGYAVCEDFYSPDYSRRSLPPDTQDHRRTLLWMPHVKFDKKGTAAVRLYNNGMTTTLCIEAEGITATGKPLVWKNTP